MSLRKALIGDIPQIHELVNAFAAQGEMLGRSRSELYEGLRDFYVADKDGTIIGCCALHINWEDLAEVRSLAVRSDQQGQGIGKALVLACLEEARQLGIERVYALTYQTDFFEGLGFHQVPKESLPQKVWADCLKCPRFPNCDEEAVIMEVA
jgi:amino-acid N-acetyltransferase